MSSHSIFLLLLSVLVVSDVRCARDIDSWTEYKYKECYLLNEKHSSLKRTPFEVIELDGICLAPDDTYRFVSCPWEFPIQFPFDNVKIVRMDNNLMVLHARLIDEDWYTTAKVEFEEEARAEDFFKKFFGRDVIERKKIIDLPMMKKIGKTNQPAVLLYREYEFQYDVQLNFIKHGDEKIFILEKLTPYLVFSEKKFQLSRVINGQYTYIVMSVEGFADSFYIFGFSDPEMADEFRDKFAENALKKDEFKFPNELDSFLGAMKIPS